MSDIPDDIQITAQQLVGERLYMTVGPHERGLLAIITDGHPQRGEGKCTVLTLEVVKNMRAAKQWFKQMKTERPWEPRS